MHLELQSRHAPALVAAVVDRVAFLNLPAPRLPGRRPETGARALSASLTIHALALLLVIVFGKGRQALPVHEEARVQKPRMVFLALPGPGGGGGGGGNRTRAPASRASAAGRERLTQPVAPPPVANTPLDMPLPAQQVAIPAVPLAVGVTAQAGVVDGVPVPASSQGPGSGGGAGEGEGSGMGSGRGPGVGPGTGGGTGGGIYRPGGGVSWPILVNQVKPSYTPDAMRNRIQGSVLLEVVVLHTGDVGDVRVLRSLDRGLDAKAIEAVRAWQFLPGRRGDIPVDVLVTVIMDFALR